MECRWVVLYVFVPKVLFGIFIRALQLTTLKPLYFIVCVEVVPIMQESVSYNAIVFYVLLQYYDQMLKEQLRPLYCFTVRIDFV